MNKHDPLTYRVIVDRESAIEMALSAGNLLDRHDDERYYWALTLVAFNLFELVGHGVTAHQRFISGYESVVGRKRDTELTFGWHEGCVARAIRNLFAHGLKAERRQRKSFYDSETATVSGVAFISDSISEGIADLYHIHTMADKVYEISFSPIQVWYYVAKWGEDRGKT